MNQQIESEFCSTILCLDLKSVSSKWASSVAQVVVPRVGEKRLVW